MEINGITQIKLINNDTNSNTHNSNNPACTSSNQIIPYRLSKTEGAG